MMDLSWTYCRAWIFLLITTRQLCMASSMAPFFFLCQYDSQSQGVDDVLGKAMEQSEIKIDVQIETNPEFYVPGTIYKFIITSSSEFDGFMMTSLFTLPKSFTRQNVFVYGLGGRHNLSTVCSIVHSQVGREPAKVASFLWMAPTAGSECVHFIATGMLRRRVIFKDIVVYRLCEFKETSGTLLSAAIEDHSVILRDDFEDYNVSQPIWENSLELTIAHDCHYGVGISNRAVKLCQDDKQNLSSVPLNMSTAGLLQFTSAVNKCANETSSNMSSGFLNVLYGSENCKKWTLIKKISFDFNVRSSLLSLPRLARNEGICLRFSRDVVSSSTNDCWILDDILLTNVAETPNFLFEKFDPMNLGSFLLLTGGKITQACRVDGNALAFRVPRHILRPISAITRDIAVTRSLGSDALPLESVLLQQDFDNDTTLEGWLIKGGYIGYDCGIMKNKMAAILNAKSNVERKTVTICTPFIDATSAGVLSFHLAYGKGAGACNATSQGRSNPIFVYADLHHGMEVHVMKLQFSEYADVRRFALPVPRKLRRGGVRFCWSQPTDTDGLSSPTWGIDSIQLLTWQPSIVSHVLQFSINVHCSRNLKAAGHFHNGVSIEFSNDGGLHWSALHMTCLPPSCNGLQVPFASSISVDGNQVGWNRVTYPLPYAALLLPTRFQFRHLGRSDVAFEWAIDDVYIGACSNGCNGHGQCIPSGCKCDPGYSGPVCDRVVDSHPQTFFEDFSSSSALMENKRFKVSGGDLGYQCGSIKTDKAVVFDRAGPRFLQTVYLNTTEIRFLDVTIQLGDHSWKGNCAGPNDLSESVYVHSSCMGGVIWNLLSVVSLGNGSNLRHLTIMLPKVAKGPACYFRIWQASHSGASMDVWALDDLSISADLTGRIFLNFSNDVAVKNSLSQYSGIIGPYCDKNRTLRIGKSSGELDVRQIVTKSFAIGPGFMLQFELVLQCLRSSNTESNFQARVDLEFSTDHGVTWPLVQDACLPSQTHCNGFFAQGTVFFASEFKNWTRKTITLSRNTWSPVTRFRFMQRSTGISWAIDNLYIGPECSDLCSGHGLCVDGVCRCDDGFFGRSCLPVEKLPVVSIDRKAMASEEIWKSGLLIAGGRLVSRDQQKTFGVVASGTTFYFNENGIRQLVTPDMNTIETDNLQFFLRIHDMESEQLANSSVQLFNSSMKCFVDDFADLSSSVLLQYSNDAGITWHLLKLFLLSTVNRVHTQLEYVLLPWSARTGCTRLRWWQPLNLAATHQRSPWALDEIRFNTDRHATSEVTLSENVALDDLIGGINDGGFHGSRTHVPVNCSIEWSYYTSITKRRFCMSDDDAMVFDGMERHRFAITKEMSLKEGDVIQFQVSIGCTDTFSSNSRVQLEYSHDHGMSWTLVQNECHPPLSFCGSFREASIYYMGTHGHWSLVMLPVIKEIAFGKVSFRWSQLAVLNHGLVDGAFALRNVYVGRPCSNWCSGRGVCVSQTCSCFDGFQGQVCGSLEAHPTKITDKFDVIGVDGFGPLWQSVYGGSIGNAVCGTLGMNNALYFDGHGTRDAMTISLDTRHTREIRFFMRLGCGNETKSAMTNQAKDTVALQYSLNNGLSWNNLHEFTYEALDPSVPAKRHSISLPREAQTMATNFRWWQPLEIASSEDRRELWALDNVVFERDDVRRSTGFFETFEITDSENWHMAFNGLAGAFCSGDKHVLFFEATKGVDQFAETNDFDVSAATFLQFDLAISCQRDSLDVAASDDSFSVRLEYSNDAGHSWSPLEDGCASRQSVAGCYRHHLIGQFSIDGYGGRWTRVTIPMPSRAVMRPARFRWKKWSSSTSRLVGWALDNVYLGDECPWMCSGHGRCLNRSCVCDSGFDGVHCVPAVKFPREFRDNFDWNANGIHAAVQWAEIFGATVTISSGSSNVSGVVTSGPALEFTSEGLRMAVTRDLDLTDAAYIQFDLKFACTRPHQSTLVRYCNLTDVISSRTRSQLLFVLLQYSSNGGITWRTLKEMSPFASHMGLTRHVITLDRWTAARTNCTQIRFWQPSAKDGHFHEWNQYLWALDSVLIGGSLIGASNVLYDTFDEGGPGARLESWLDWPGGHIDNLCNSSNGRRALVFDLKYGERAAYTRDVQVNDRTVIQFEIRVGCGFHSTNLHPIRLEYSTDRGRTWHSVSNCDDFTGEAFSTTIVATTWYANTEKDWIRVVLPLDGLGIGHGTARFRWVQGYFSDQTEALDSLEWGVDTVYIGPGCVNHCSGHGLCLNGIVCQCDALRDGVTCERPLQSNPSFFREEFDTTDLTDPPVQPLQLSNVWKSVSGAEISTACRSLISSSSLVFNQPGRRQLITRDLNLTSASNLQFYLRLGCSTPRLEEASPMLLHFSVDGGIHWSLLDEYSFSSDSLETASFVSVYLPDEVRSESCRLRWSQPSVDGTFLADWSIDQIILGYGDQYSFTTNDSLGYSNANRAMWLLTSGGTLQPVCKGAYNMLLFAGDDMDRFAVTTDIFLKDSASVLQFELVMGCKESPLCYEVQLEYSSDAGKSWHLVYEKCAPFDTNCSAPREASIYSSDLYYGHDRITISLPPHARSGGTRFRWMQQRPFRSGQTWALGSVYLGPECSGVSGGHASCLQDGRSKCDDGWIGAACDVTNRSLPSDFREEFSSARLVSTNIWKRIAGGVVSDLCGSLGRGSAIHFYGGCSRLLETTPLNLRNASDVRFFFKFGCLSRPIDRHQSVVIQYSDDNGLNWFTLKVLDYDRHNDKSLVTIALPARVRQSGISLRWWQPEHSGRVHGDWALDDVLITSRSAALPEVFVDLFNNGDGSFMDVHRWAYANNVEVTSFCDSNLTIAVGDVVNGDGDAVLETKDIKTEGGRHVLEFTLLIGCNINSDRIPPVHLQYSLDQGFTWYLVTKECLSDDASSDCVHESVNGSSERPASIYDAGFHTASQNSSSRTTIRLSAKLASSAIRFRWIQFVSELTKGLVDAAKWGLREIYIGPGCPNLCNGHGSSRSYPICTCDKNFTGPDCAISRKPLLNYLRDSFDDGHLNSSCWHGLWGGSIDLASGFDVDGGAVVLNLCGLRLLETVDMDLQDSKFVLYFGTAKNLSKTSSCTSLENNLHLQYSKDGGITWFNLHVLTSSSTGTYHYIALPRESRTQTTRLRWWQSREKTGCCASLKSDCPSISWIIDSVLIAGSNVNPDELHDTFDDESLSDEWWFAPGSQIGRYLCNDDLGSTALVWKKATPGKRQSRNAVTRQLIIGRNYILRFKILMGCQVDRVCERNLVVNLEFRTDPNLDEWHAVRNGCFTSNTVTAGCVLGEYFDGTIYKLESPGKWTQVIVDLPASTISGDTQFRWRQPNFTEGTDSEWAIKDVHIGEACVDDCSHPIGRHCVRTQDDDYCMGMAKSIKLSSGIYDDFDDFRSDSNGKWMKIMGAHVSQDGCGNLTPWGHNKRVFFDGCRTRQIVTSALNLKAASKLIYVVKSCNLANSSMDMGKTSLLVQYSVTRGRTWMLLASNRPMNFLRPLRVVLNLPEGARASQVHLRWWQPDHSGPATDQWALDGIEIIE